MPKLNHIACLALDPLTTGKFYAAIFNMTFDHRVTPGGYVSSAREGYVGLNFNQLMPGRPGPVGLDHFGIEVEDIEDSFRMAEKNYPTIEWQKRSGGRPYAQVGIHDPDGQVVDINQKNLDPSISEVKPAGFIWKRTGSRIVTSPIWRCARRTRKPAPSFITMCFASNPSTARQATKSTI